MEVSSLAIPGRMKVVAMHEKQPKGSITYRVLRRVLGEVGLTKVWEHISSFYLWNAFPLNGKDPRLFQVVGIPRSGTTLLCSSLDSHSRIICISEPYHQWKHNGFVYAEKILQFDIWKRHPSFLIEQLLKVHKDKMIGFKETYYSESHGHYKNYFFFKKNFEKGIKTIVIVRDPREVWKSLVIMHSEKKGKVPDRFLEAWNDLTEWALRNNIFLIKYESLISNPVYVLQKVCSYLVVEFEFDMLHLRPKLALGDPKALKGGSIVNKSLEFEKFLTKDEILKIERGCFGLMKALGYKPIQLAEQYADEADEN